MTTPFDNRRDWFRNELRNFFRDAAGNGSRSWSGPSRAWRSRRSRTAGAFPPVNIYDDGEGFRLRAELPGVDKEDLDIHAQGDEITIRGKRNIAPPEDEADWHRRERQGGNFRRTVTLPQAIDADKVTANLKLGVLDVYAPRAREQQPKQIEIE